MSQESTPLDGGDIDYSDVLGALADLPDAVTAILLREPKGPASGSRAERDYSRAGGSPSLRTIIERGAYRAAVGLTVAADACRATARLLDPPSVSYVKGGVVRDGMEAAGVCLWLLDRREELAERARRVLGLVKEDLSREDQIVEAIADEKDPASESVVHQAIADIARRRAELDRLAQQAGLAYGHVPSMTSQFRYGLGALFEFRIYSGLAHGSDSAVGYAREVAAGAFEVTLMNDVADHYARAAWAAIDYRRPDRLTELRQTLESHYDRLHWKDAARWFRDCDPDPWLPRRSRKRANLASAQTPVHTPSA